LFKRKEEYPSHLETIIKLTIIIASIVVVFVLPFYWFYKYEGQGIAMFLVLFLLTSPLIAYTFKKLIYFRKNEIQLAIASKSTKLVMISIVNISVFLTIGFNMLIDLKVLFLLYLLSYLPLILSIYFNQSINPPRILFTLITSVFLLINYYFSYNPKIEKYTFTSTIQRGKSGMSETTFIQLESDKYIEYIGIRMFFDFSKMYRKDQIAYTIEEGFLGISVVKEYKFY
jgi:hypothetical protein